MVLGVNDESQISDLSLFAQRGEEYLNQIIKVKTNEMNEENTDRKAHELLAKSDLLYIYGMSIGETDALWWQRVCELLHSKKSLHVIIQQHDSPANHILQRRFVTFQNQIRNRIVSFWGGDLDQKNAIKKRIHVDRINIFSQLENLVKETDSEEENSFHAS